jgi:RimJ/RimL family protein N-acetyltransferase
MFRGHWNTIVAIVVAGFLIFLGVGVGVFEPDQSAGGDPTGVAFAIVDAASGEPVGMCGIDSWSNTDVAQFGYWLAPAARGSGLATRAVMLMTTWMFKLGAARVFLTIQSENTTSAAVARRAGYTLEGTLRGHDVWRGHRQDVDVFAILPHEWPSARNR